MSNYVFSPSERLAVFTVHLEKCYLCSRPLDLNTMEVDHILPEHLLKNPIGFSTTRRQLGRSDSFEINSFENWMPSCKPCNGKKSGIIFDPSLLVQICLQIAASKAIKAAQIAARSVTDAQLAKALNIVNRAGGTTTFSQVDETNIEPIISLIEEERTEEMLGEEIRITPLYTVLSSRDGITTVQGRYGIGSRPSTEKRDSSWTCSYCGIAVGWNGVRCVGCGQMDCD